MTLPVIFRTSSTEDRESGPNASSIHDNPMRVFVKGDTLRKPTIGPPPAQGTIERRSGMSTETIEPDIEVKAEEVFGMLSDAGYDLHIEEGFWPEDLISELSKVRDDSDLSEDQRSTLNEFIPLALGALAGAAAYRNRKKIASAAGKVAGTAAKAYQTVRHPIRTLQKAGRDIGRSFRQSYAKSRYGGEVAQKATRPERAAARLAAYKQARSPQTQANKASWDKFHSQQVTKPASPGLSKTTLSPASRAAPSVPATKQAEPPEYASWSRVATPPKSSRFTGTQASKDVTSVGRAPRPAATNSTSTTVAQKPAAAIPQIVRKPSTVSVSARTPVKKQVAAEDLVDLLGRLEGVLK